MTVITIIMGLTGGWAVGYWVVPVSPAWAVPWLVVSALFFASLLAAALKNRVVAGAVAAGFLLTVGLLLLERFSGIALSPAVILFWVFCLFRECGALSSMELES